MLVVMAPGYLIDGYNLLHCFPALGQLLSRDVEAARDRLVRMLAAFRSGKRIRLTVVFDGRMPAGSPPADHALGIKLLFAGPESADERIVRLVRRSRQPRSWTVVSSDRWVKENAGDYGAGTMSSERFVALMQTTRKPARAPAEDKPEMVPQDVAYWEEYFRNRGREAGR